MCLKIKTHKAGVTIKLTWNGILALLRVKMCKYVWFAAARRGVSGEEVDAEDHTATRDGDEAVPLPAEEGLPEEQRLHQKGL